MEGDRAHGQWARENFGEAELGDARRTRRLVQLAAAMHALPDKSLPKQCQGHAPTTGAYRLLSNPDVDPQAIHQPHRRRVAQACRSQPVTLLIHDPTELNFSKRGERGTLQGIGPLGRHNGGGHGLIHHGVLAVTPAGEVKGAAYQDCHVQQRTLPGETRRQRRQRGTEADHWGIAACAIDQEDYGDSRLIHIGDRHSDVFGFMLTVTCLKHGFVVRAMHDRYVDQGVQRLQDKLARQPVAGRQTIQIPARSGPPKTRRPARKARLALRYAPVTLPPPRNDPRFTRVEPLRIWAVQLTEIDPPSDQEPIHWTLLTSEPVNSPEDAWRIVGWYRRRWIIEEWHKVIKETCRLEASQLDDAEDIKRLAAIVGPMATDLLHLRDLARDEDTADDPEALRAAPLVTPAVLAVAAAHCKVAPEDLTPRRFWRLLATKGGHLGRKRDGQPGWKAIWTGWQQIDQQAQGYDIAQAQRDSERRCVEG